VKKILFGFIALLVLSSASAGVYNLPTPPTVTTAQLAALTASSYPVGYTFFVSDSGTNGQYFHSNGTNFVAPLEIQTATDSSDTTTFLLFGNASGTQQQQAKSNTSLIFNASTGALGATSVMVNGATALSTGNYLNITGNLNSYVQANIQNSSTGTAASSDYVVTTNTGSDSTEYADFGINNSGWTGSSWGAAKDAYLFVDGSASGVGNLYIGTQQASTKVKFSVAGSGTNSSAGILELTSTVAKVTGNAQSTQNTITGYATTATAAGTTTLTVTSAQQQFFTGSTTQTCVLPDATTLTLGTTYIIHDNATGNVTVNANGGGNIGTVIPRSEAKLTVTDISTAAGVWDFLPSEGANYQATPSDPSTTTNTTGVMMGLAGSITPVKSGKVLFIISGDIDNSGTGNTAQVQLRTGTGSAPTNGAALTGTTRGGLVRVTNPTVALSSPVIRAPFSVQGVATGLTLGTAVWIDVGLAATGGGTARIRNISISAVEQ
jgi:hypothetical protein